MIDRNSDRAISRLVEPARTSSTMRRSVEWHLANPPEEPDDDFSADDSALERYSPSVESSTRAS